MLQAIEYQLNKSNRHILCSGPSWKDESLT